MKIHKNNQESWFEAGDARSGSGDFLDCRSDGAENQDHQHRKHGGESVSGPDPDKPADKKAQADRKSAQKARVQV